MADDDLFSLDFTALSAPPAQAPTPASAPAPAPKLTLELVPNEPTPAKAAPAPTAASVSAPAPAPAAPTLPPPLLEAAELHAGGDYLGASKKLEALLKSGGKLGSFGDVAWLGLFEVLNDLNRREPFDKLALTYAQHFEKSPPPWIDVEVASVVQDSSGAGAAFRVPATLDTSIGPALKDLMQAARTVHSLEIDVSAVSTVDDAGATLALRAIKALRDAKREIVLLGADSLAKHLGETLEPMDKRNEPQWLLLIALFDSLDNQDAFEDAAVNYAVTFEVSPPSWEPRDRSKVKQVPVPAASTPTTTASPAASAPGTPALAGEITAPCTALVAAITASATPSLVLDAARLRRIDAPAANELQACLQARKTAGASILIEHLPVLPLLFLTHHGWPAVATLRQRKA